MDFVIKHFNRNSSDQDLINDMVRVAKLVNRNTLTLKEYSQYGNFHESTIRMRFGGWLNALEKAGLDNKRSNFKLSKEDIIFDLKHVAKKLNKNTLTTFDYDNYGKYSVSGVSTYFNGSWLKALREAGLKESRFYKVTNDQYFKNLEEVWRKLGRQPKYIEMEKPLSQFSRKAYERRFGSWRSALDSFSKSVGQPDNHPLINEETNPNLIEETKNIILHKTPRIANYKLRYLVMRRDNFKCVKCGRNPANDQGVELVIDHIISWDKGGETIYENLQTLCKDCNIGKSNLD